MTDVGIDEVLQVWAELLHFAGRTALAHVAQSGLKGIQRAAGKLRLELCHLIGDPASQVLPRNVRRYFLRSVGFIEWGQPLVPVFFQRMEIDNRQEPRQENQLCAKARDKPGGAAPVAGQTSATERGEEGLVKIFARLSESEKPEEQDVGNEHEHEECGQ